MDLTLAALPGVITSCLLVWVLLRLIAQHDDERATMRASYDIRLSALFAEQAELLRAHDALHESHRRELAAINQARCEEILQLCQRAETVATAEASAEQQRPPLDLEDDLELIEEQERRLQAMGILTEAPT